MGSADVELLRISEMKDSELKIFLKMNGLSLTLDEARRVVRLIGRNPTLTEIHIFNIQWSEHSSYKSSRNVLKLLPTKAPNVILGPVEDSGIVELGSVGKERYGIVISHESHNHPSQIVPYEGAATGVGGILRDVLCMGAKILATADPLRFGNAFGINKNKVRYIANEVINGIAGYGNAVGIPNIAGDIYFDDSFDDNCLVNVVCIGIVKEKDIIHSYAPKNSENYDIIIVGKPTDNSGFGGAAFASLILDEYAKEDNRGSVQVPDPFLKNVIIRATYQVFEEAKKSKIDLRFKDLGAGGIMCATSELCSDGNMGARINLDNVLVSMELPAFMLINSETQERFAFICPPEFSNRVLEIYNKEFALSSIAQNAGASIIGKVTKEQDYIVKHKGKIVCNVPIKAITSGIRYDRPSKEFKTNFKEPQIKDKPNYNQILLKVLSHPSIASKAKCFNHYDKNVMGNTVIESGQADAGLIKPLENSKYGLALTVDCNPYYGIINPYLCAVNAVAESMRNVVSIGAIPSALTDCLNFGNPEKPKVFYEFKESVRGIADAANNIFYYKTNNPVPVISGNVSFYNESKLGKRIAPSPIISCIGIMKDYSNAITMKFKKSGSNLFMVGKRKNFLGGSVYYKTLNEIGKNVPEIDFKSERNSIYAILDCINSRLLLSCHDITDGGFATTISEMALGGNADGKIGARIIMEDNMRNDQFLFSENSGFVFEADKKSSKKIEEIFKNYGIDLFSIGKTTNETSLIINNNFKEIINLPIEELRKSWTSGFVKAIK